MITCRQDVIQTGAAPNLDRETGQPRLTAAVKGVPFPCKHQAGRL